MADPVVKTFDLYNTTFYWIGYRVEGYENELKVAKAYYITNFSSNVIGSKIDFFAELAGQAEQNTAFDVGAGNTIDTLRYMWGKYWWDEATYYSSDIVLSAVQVKYPTYYRSFSECIGTLAYISRSNNLLNTQTKPYSTLLDRLLIPGLSAIMTGFYLSANQIFNTALTAIGPGTGTDTAPASSNLIMADSDLRRRITSNNTLTATINGMLPKLYRFLPYNTSVIGNLFTPYYWSYTMPYEDIDYKTRGTGTIIVDRDNSPIATSTQLSLSSLQVQSVL